MGHPAKGLTWASPSDRSDSAHSALATLDHCPKIECTELLTVRFLLMISAVRTALTQGLDHVGADSREHLKTLLRGNERYVFTLRR